MNEKIIPDWLASGVLNNTLNYDKSIKTSFKTFLNFVTLHDSRLLLASVCSDIETFLILEFDELWNCDFASNTDDSNHSPFLVIKIPETLNISFSLKEYPINRIDICDCKSESISIDEIMILIDKFLDSKLFQTTFYEKLIDCKDLQKTTFFYCCGDSLEILHDAEIQLYLIDQDGTYRNISFDNLAPLYQNEE